MVKNIETPLSANAVKNLRAGDSIFLTGYIYTGRDAAHKRMIDSLNSGEKLPIDIENEVIYYVGPTPARENQTIGAAGPTTSYRMDVYTESLLELGLKGMIGKGNRDKKVINSIVKNKAVYLGAIGGAAAKISKCIKSSEIVAYADLGPEAIRKMYVENLPLIVVIDIFGNNYYEIGQKVYRESKMD